FLSNTWTSVIHGYDSLKPHLLIRIASTASTVMPGLAAPLNPKAIIDNFLSGHGVPCPSLFSEARGTFSRLIQLDKIDTAAFRSLSLCWAVTGSPHLESGDQQHIELTWVGSGDAGYEAVPSRRAALMALGKISFRTCFRTARIPVSYLNHLASQSYPAKDKDGNETEPFTLQQAIDHWLLVEILGGIGDHSMV
ncbi:hypothetical protein R3P38DRAFT_2574134, partial [Favolaschia claudopus]